MSRKAAMMASTTGVRQRRPLRGRGGRHVPLGQGRPGELGQMDVERDGVLVQRRVGVGGHGELGQLGVGQRDVQGAK